jgi:hypothetical protein
MINYSLSKAFLSITEEPHPYGLVNNLSFSCAASTLSGDILHIPDVLFPDGITHYWVDFQYSLTLSTAGNAYYLVANYGILATSY